MLSVARPSAPLRGRAPLLSRGSSLGLSCTPPDKETDTGFAHSLVNWVFSPAPSDDNGCPDFVPPLAGEAARRRVKPGVKSEGGLTRMNRPDALQLTLAAATGLAAPPGHDGPGEELPLSSRTSPSPRRSRVLAFTCNVCGQRSRRAVNPGVLETGTLFVQCSNENCMVFHKVVDNLGLFSELTGPVFNPPPIRDARVPSTTPLVGLGGWAAAAGLDVDDLLNNLGDSEPR